jgi:hypothetical protein
MFDWGVMKKEQMKIRIFKFLDILTVSRKPKISKNGSMFFN